MFALSVQNILGSRDSAVSPLTLDGVCLYNIHDLYNIDFNKCTVYFIS